jgi:hypothetical protein
MARIISKRGQPKVKEPCVPAQDTQVYVIDTGEPFCPTPEELENIRRVFDNIRKQLDDIGI